MVGITLEVAKITVSAAEIIAQTPRTLVATPGANKVLVPISAFAVVKAGATPFTGGQADNAITIGCGDDGGPTFETWLINTAIDGAITSAVDSIAPLGVDATFSALNSAYYDDLSYFADRALIFQQQYGTVYADGNGTMRVTVAYYEVDFS